MYDGSIKRQSQWHTNIPQVKTAKATKVVFTVWHGARKHVACLRTVKSLVENMVIGVTKVGYRGAIRGLDSCRRECRSRMGIGTGRVDDKGVDMAFWRCRRLELDWNGDVKYQWSSGRKSGCLHDGRMRTKKEYARRGRYIKRWTYYPKCKRHDSHLPTSSISIPTRTFT